MYTLEELNTLFDEFHCSSYNKQVYFYKKARNSFLCYSIDMNIDEYTTDLFNYYNSKKLKTYDNIAPIEPRSAKQTIDFVSSEVLNQTDGINIFNTIIDIDNNLITENISKDSFNRLSGFIIKLYNKENTIFIINSKNPIKSFKKRNMFFQTNSTTSFKQCNNNVLVFPYHIDCLIINGKLYLLTEAIRTLFNYDLQSRNNRDSFLKQLDTSEIFDTSTKERIESFCNIASYETLFSDYDESKFSNFLNNPHDVSRKIDIDITTDGIILTDDDESIENLIYYVCGRLHQDLDDENTLRKTGSRSKKYTKRKKE